MVGQTYEKPSRLITMTDTETPGDRLKALREARGLSLREAGRLAGLSHATIQQLERGVSNPDNVQEGTLNALARAYNKTPQAIRDVIAGREPYAGAGVEGAALLESHPDWAVLPVYSGASAGAVAPQSIPGEEAFVPRERMRQRRTMVGDAVTYLMDHHCLISEEARRAPKAPVLDDKMTVSKTAEPEPGELIASWWPAAEKLVITRYGVDGNDVVCYPPSVGKPPVMLPLTEDLLPIGPIIFRGG